MPDTRSMVDRSIERANREFQESPEEALGRDQLPDKESAALVYHGETGEGGRPSVRADRDAVSIVASDKTTGAVFDGLQHTTSFYGSQIGFVAKDVFWNFSKLNPDLKDSIQGPIRGWAATYQPTYITLAPTPTETLPGPPDAHIHSYPHTHELIVKPLQVFEPEVLGLAKFPASIGKFVAEALKIAKGGG